MIGRAGLFDVEGRTAAGGAGAGRADAGRVTEVKVFGVMEVVMGCDPKNGSLYRQERQYQLVVLVAEVVHQEELKPEKV